MDPESSRDLNLDTLTNDTFVQIGQYLPIAEIQAVACLSHLANLLVEINLVLWQRLCVRDFAVHTPQKQTEKTTIGLAQKSLSWKDFYLNIQRSAVFTWGAVRSIGRFDDPTKPMEVPELSKKGINHVGKTAEVGSICVSKSGTKLYCWGRSAGSQTPVESNVANITQDPTDRVIHSSCGHDSKFLILTKNGRFFRQVHNSSGWLELTSIYSKELQPGESPLWCLGSQAGTAAVVTNFSNTFVFNCGYSLSTDNRDVVPPPYNGAKFIKAGFGHTWFFAITHKGELYSRPATRYNFDGDSITQWNPIITDSEVVDVDGGSRHQGFVTKKGEAWTWGNGNQGVLGHGDEDSRDNPTRVEWFVKQNMKVVAIGCGGHGSWAGGFTLYLLDDNRLFFSGELGSDFATLPELVKLDELKERHILSISAGEDWAAIVASGSTA